MLTGRTLVDSLFDRYVAGRDLPSVSGGDGNAPAPTLTPTPAPEPAPDLSKLVADAIAKAGDPNAALKSLVADNYALRDDLKAVKSKLPGDGSVVLSGDEAKDWGVYRTLGKPGDVRKALDEGTTYKTEATAFKREKFHAEVATLTGFKAPVLDRLAATDGLTIMIKDEKTKDGKDVKVPHVQLDGDKTTPLTAYAEAKWKDFLPALKGSQAQSKPALDGTPAANPYHPAPKPTVTPEQGRTRRPNAL